MNDIQDIAATAEKSAEEIKLWGGMHCIAHGYGHFYILESSCDLS